MNEVDERLFQFHSKLRANRQTATEHQWLTCYHDPKDRCL